MKKVELILSCYFYTMVKCHSFSEDGGGGPEVESGGVDEVTEVVADDKTCCRVGIMN